MSASPTSTSLIDHRSSPGTKRTLTSDISARTVRRRSRMVSSRRVDCSIVRFGETLAVKSTNSRAPARFARRFSMASIDWAVFSDAEEASRESRDRDKDESIFFETPASVSSPKALFMIAMPWFNITADTTRPEQRSEDE